MLFAATLLRSVAAHRDAAGGVWSSVQAMGFERDDVVAALRATQNNRGMAVNRLLQMSSS